MEADFLTNQASPSVQKMSRVLEESASLLTSDRVATLGLPDDEMHRDILLPLLPAMLSDRAIRAHWFEKPATGFVARVRAAIEESGGRPEWRASDFEIHVAASYLAGPDARALADTLLSEEPLREMTAAIMNAALQAVWDPISEVAPIAVSASSASSSELAAQGTPVVPSMPVYIARIIRFAQGVHNRTRRRVIRISGAGTFITRRGLTAGSTAFRTTCR